MCLEFPNLSQTAQIMIELEQKCAQMTDPSPQVVAMHVTAFLFQLYLSCFGEDPDRSLRKGSKSSSKAKVSDDDEFDIDVPVSVSKKATSPSRSKSPTAAKRTAAGNKAAKAASKSKSGGNNNNKRGSTPKRKTGKSPGRGRK